MGAAQSNNEPNYHEEQEDDPWWPKTPAPDKTTDEASQQYPATLAPTELPKYVPEYSRSLDSHEKLEIFKKHLEEKRIERQTLIKQKKLEMEQMKQDLEFYKKENALLKSQLGGKEPPLNNETPSTEKLEIENAELRQQVLVLSEKLEEVGDKNKRLQIDIASLQNDLQSLNTDLCDHAKQKEEYEKHILALKDIINISKKMILIREQEMKELQQKVKIIETSLRDREMHTMSNELRQEYERQLRNIRNLRELYDERARLCRAEVKNAQDLLTDAQEKLTSEQNKNVELEQRVTELEENVSKKYDDISSLESNLGLSKAECRGLKHEMAIINQLAAQFLLGFNKSLTPQEFDLDKLIKLLEENHDLLTDINGKDDSSDTTPALPRLLLDLVQESKTETESDTGQESSGNPAEEIITNLPKVWKVLMELLSHQTVQPVEINAVESSAKDDPCYKTVETPSGTRYELSVSKTYIRLKDLIVEKKYLQKEMHKMKKLNTHLEERLQEQESRLHLVTKELSKTWHIVGRMQRQHEQLHTHEKILRYELSQKRKMLNELKEELELCKEKWVQAREKNTASEHACRKLRSEFATRKAMDDFGNNSAESGYSDEQEGLDSDDDDDQVVVVEKKGEENILETITEGESNEVVNELSDEGGTSHEGTCEDLLTIIENESESEEPKCESTETQHDLEPPSSMSSGETPSEDSGSTNLEALAPIESNEANLELYEKIRLAEEELETSLKKFLKPQQSQLVVSQIPSELPITVPSGPSKITTLPNVETTTTQITEEDKISVVIPVEKVSSTVLADAEEFARRREERFRRMEEHCASIKNTYSKHVSVEPTASTSRGEDRNGESREDKFKRLEEHCSQLKERYSSNSKRGTELCARLDAVHEVLTENEVSENQDERTSTTSDAEITDEVCQNSDHLDDIFEDDQTTDL